MKRKTSTALVGAWLALLLAPPEVLHGADAGVGGRAGQADPKDTAIVLSVFEVTGDRDVGYRSTQTVASTRTLENLRDTPNSISIINRELLNNVFDQSYFRSASLASGSWSGRRNFRLTTRIDF